ncbi:autophagy-related protein 9-like isoform X1 [Cucurbita pepo subsp. pepo]|uniref:autophagy-related protein 9-like isoform X1 n=2 Tax=Cucurbita pepo subsp. pepo TaxID=3664 RepID=UPI000C9DA4ED|nr:autophagy-related protein 9-like isoform X1 [Cucurbita pepo subsp. pepo]XP_023554283.1 autophagy-related protein 9-like isoform X1 [Cucurbita pepo subsp. pepo]
MMLSGTRDADNVGIFRWKARGESSLTSSLLKDVAPEIELSTFGRVPNLGSESPTELLDGERLSVEPIADLDLFFERLYSYYCDKGLWCIITKWIVELLSLGFTICFSAFFLLFVDWNGLRNAKCGMDAVESGTKPCDLAKEALHEHPLRHMTVSKAIIIGYLGIFSVYWTFCFLRFFAQLKDILGIRHFYYNSLQISDNEIKTMPWATILEKVVELQSTRQLCVAKDLSAHDVVMRLMRKENYLIGMLNKGVLAFPISQWVPGAGPAVKFDSFRNHYRLTLTKSLEWTLNWCILQSMFDRNYCVRREFISNPRTLKKRLAVVGVVMLLLSPFLVIFMLVYLFLRHAEQFYNHPSTASSRRWSNLSKWIFREFNEVEHLFKHRMNSSVLHASEYLKQFPSPIISIIAKFISFVFGGFAAILIIIAFLDESLLEGHIFGRNLLWYAAVFGTITAISRAAVTDEILVLDPEGAMSIVVQHTHYMPKRWRGKENSERVRLEFETLFQYTGMMLLEEMVSIFLTPFLLVFVVPERVDDILQFIADFTVHIEGVGHVCSFSTFDFPKHGNISYGSPHTAPGAERSSQGKMEKSFLSFCSSYPAWEPNAQGKQFLSNLQTFRDRMLQRRGHVYQPQEIHQGRRSSIGHRDRNRVFSGELPRPNSAAANWMDFLWLDEHHRNFPYLLDHYYTNAPRDKASNSGDIPEEPSESMEPNSKVYWTPPDFTRKERSYEDYWKEDHPMDRSQSQLGASTSAPIVRESIFQHQDFTSTANPDTKTQWWDRNIASWDQPETSFMEPPDFNRHTTMKSRYDNISERSSEERQQMEWSGFGKLSRATYLEDIETGELDLHFGDVYSETPDALKPESTRFE